MDPSVKYRKKTKKRKKNNINKTGQVNHEWAYTPFERSLACTLGLLDDASSVVYLPKKNTVNWFRF